MDTTASGPSAGGREQPGPGPQPMAFQNALNRVLRGLLRTPLLCRLVGRRLVTLYVIGRNSGRRFSIPVAYLRDGDALLVGTPFRWGRNLRTGEPIEIRWKGARRRAEVEVITDETGVVDGYRRMARANHAFAGFNGIGLDPAGEPEPADLRRAWAGGARVIRLSPGRPG